MLQLYAALGASSTTSDLYTVDSATGVMTSIGPIGFALTGMAVHPITGVLYGSTSNNSAANPRSLITINPVTGAGTLVGSFGLSGMSLTDLAFDSSGNLYGNDSNGASKLWSVDTSTGVATAIGSTVSTGYSGGLDFLSSVLWLVGDGAFRVSTIDKTTGVRTVQGNIGVQLEAGKFDGSGTFWGSKRVSSTVSSLVTVNLSTFVVTTVATFSIGRVDAICWADAVAPNFDFTLSAPSISVVQGDSATSTATFSLLSGSTETASLSALGVPTGVTVSFSPTSVNENGGTSTITIDTLGSTPLGTYSITIKATDSDEFVTKTITLTVTVPLPTNDSCANARVLSGLSGSSTADNTSWSGSWPTGADPLFNAYPTRGGGAPLWWKWTNIYPDTVDFSVTFHRNTKDFNGGVAVGTCGSLVMNTSVYGVDTNNGDSDWELANLEQFDARVEPGETVFIEFDSYHATAGTEPPTASGAQRGLFGFTWEVDSVTLRDSITAESVVLADISAGRIASMSGFGTEIWDSTIFNNRFYALWTFEYNSSFPVTSEVWVSSCALDGSDLQSQRILLLTPSTPFGSAAFPGAHIRDPAGGGPYGRLVNDGTKIVALVQRYLVINNPDYTGTMPTNGGANEEQSAIRYSFDFWVEGGSHVWTLLNTINAVPSVAFSPNMRHRVCASSDHAGVAYFGFGYYRRKLARNDSTVFSDQIEDRFTRYSIDLTSGSVTLLLDETSGLVTYSSGTFTIPSAVSTYYWDIADDTTNPVMVRVKRTATSSSGDTYDTVVSVERFDTGSVIRTINFTDILPTGLFSYAGLAASTQSNLGNLSLRIFPKLTIGGQSKRLISWDWAGTYTQGKWLHIINSDFSGAIDQLENAVTLSSRYTLNFSSVPKVPLYDTGRNVWIAWTNTTVGQYDFNCSHSWDFYGIGNNIGQQYGGWNSNSFYAMNSSLAGDALSIRKIGPIIRNYYLCSVGSVYVPIRLGNLAIGRIMFRAWGS